MSGFIKLSDVLEESNGTLFFECPGCKMLHGVNINRPNSPNWSWDGNKSKPTFSPSVREHVKEICFISLSFVTATVYFPSDPRTGWLIT